MPEMITHVPSQEELEKLAMERATTLETSIVPEVRRLDTPVKKMHRAEVAIDVQSSSIYDPSDIGLPSTNNYAVMGELQMGGDESKGMFAIVRQKTDDGEAFLLAGMSRDPSGQNPNPKFNGTFLELQEGVAVELGRAPRRTTTWEQHKFLSDIKAGEDPSISATHARVTYEEGRILVQDISTNGSLIRSNSEITDLDTHIAEHTSFAHDKARLKGLMLESMGEERFNGRIPIGRDTTIDGSDAFVDLRSWVAGGEAIIVDSIKYPESFNKLIGIYNDKLKQNVEEGLVGEIAVLKSVFDTVSSTMEYDLDFVNKFSAKVAAKSNNEARKIALNAYLDEGKGVCRHMALTAAWMTGELARNGILEGKTTTEVNQRKADNAAHEWARYTAKDGTVYILDPAQNYAGRLDESLRRHGSWEYFRPGERMKYELLEQQRAARIGGIIMPSLAERINGR